MPTATNKIVCLLRPTGTASTAPTHAPTQSRLPKNMSLYRFLWIPPRLPRGVSRRPEGQEVTCELS